MLLRIPAKIPLSITIIVLFFILFFLQNQILSYRGLPPKLVIKPGEFAILVALGGLRGVAADLLYLKADEFWQQGKWKEMLSLYRAITILQPRYVDYWSLAGFHLAWSLPFTAKTAEEKQKYIQQGIDFFKEGISYNPDVYKLYFDLAFIYDHKFSQYDEAIKWYKKAAEFPDHIPYIDRAVAHCLRKKGDFKGAYEEWQRLKKLYPEDKDYQEIVALNLKIVEEELKKSDK